MKAHPIADLLPMLEGEEFRALVADIASHGLREPITLTPDGQILDGRNRYAACLAASVEPRTVTHDGDPLAFVISENVRRRHLNESQRAMFAARLANMGEGRPAKKTAQICAVELVSQADAAAQLNVSRRSVQTATALQREAPPETIAAVDRGEVAVSQAVRQIKEQKRETARLENHVHVDEAPDIHSLCHGTYRTVVIDPGCVSVERASAEEDRSGTDYWAHRAQGLRPLSVDLKARSVDPIRDYGADDLALETWSVVGDKPGWTRDPQKQTDYILWLWTPTRRFFLVPFPALCNVFQRYWVEWSRTYKTRTQDSGGWQSECVFVPRSVVIATLNRWMEGAAA